MNNTLRALNEGFDTKYLVEILKDPEEKRFNNAVHTVFDSMFSIPFEVHHLRQRNNFSDIILIPWNDKYRVHNFIHTTQWNNAHPDKPHKINLSVEEQEELMNSHVYMIKGELIEIPLKDVLK